MLLILPIYTTEVKETGKPYNGGVINKSQTVWNSTEKQSNFLNQNLQGKEEMKRNLWFKSDI